MRKSCRSTVSAETKMVALFDYVQTSADWTKWTKWTVSAQKASAMEMRGEAVKVTREVNGKVELVGYQRTQPVRESRPTPATLTFATMTAVGKRAQGCRLSRAERRQVEKFVMWPLEGDKRNPSTVRPRISEQDQRRIDGLMLTGSLEMAERLAAA